jgi:hypothetical protein
MHRGAVRFGALLSTLTPCASVLAHGDPPAAYAVLSHDAEGVRAVRLSAGVALRRAHQRFEFVCPSAWGDMYAAPLAALADGSIVVGATSGLMLLGEDGRVRVHPDPAAAGDSSEVVRSPHGVFSLRTTNEGSEVLAIDAQTVRVLWKDTKSLYSLAALDDELVLLRANGTTLEQVTIAAADGAELDRQLAVVAAPVDYAFARATADTAYALVEFRTASVLGTLRMNTFSQIAEGEITVAGPLRAGESTLLALDGKLSELVEGQARPLAESHNVLCLAESDGLSYACHPEGIARVTGRALGEPLFQLSWLVAPNFEQLALEARSRCNAQWQDLRIDLLMAGTALPEDASLDAGSALADAAIPADAGALQQGDAAITEGGLEAREASVVNSGLADAAGQPVKRGGAHCAAVFRRGEACAAHVYVAALVLTLTFARRRRHAAHKICRDRADL